MTDDTTIPKPGAGWKEFAAARRKAWADLFPMTVNEIKYEEPLPPIGQALSGIPGAFVSINPVGDDKTYLGMYLGDASTGYRCVYNKETKTLTVGASMSNPAIWVFDLNRVVMGYESWWGEIESEDDLKQITNADIENVWYVKALRALSKAHAAADDDAPIMCLGCAQEATEDEYWECPTCHRHLCLQCHEERACNGDCAGCMLGEPLPSAVLENDR